MANIVNTPFDYYGDPRRGRPLFNAKIFIGVADLDPTIPANQLQASYVQEDGIRVNLTQPIRTNSGGYPVNSNGDLITIEVQDANFSFIVQDRSNIEVINVSNSDSSEDIESRILTIQGQVLTLQGQVLTIQGQTLTIQGQIPTSQEQLLGLGSSIFPEDIDTVAENHDGENDDVGLVPAGTTHLRVSIGGNPEIVAISPVSAGGVITLLTENGCSIGGVITSFEQANLDQLTVNFLRADSEREASAVVNANAKSGDLSLNGENSVALLGDSISFGVGSVDVPTNSYGAILGRCINREYGGRNVGFIGLIPASESLIHTVSTIGSWTGLAGAAAAHSISGYARESLSSSARLNVVVSSSTSDNFDVWYTRQPSGGSFGVYVNDALVSTVSTAGGVTKQGYFRAANFPMTPDADGNVNISIRPQGNGAIEIVGIAYNSSSLTRLQNFSHPGRRAQFLTEDIINRASNGAKFLIFSLGHNDQNATGDDLQAVLDNLDLVSTRCAAFNTKLVVCDFIWDKDYSNRVKAKLREIGEENNSLYIEFSRQINIDQSTPTASDLISLGFLADSSHPTARGHKVIAETIAKTLRLSVSSKSEAAEVDNNGVSIYDFTPTVQNATLTDSNAFYTIEDGGYVNLQMRLKFTAISSTSDIIITIPSSIAFSARYTSTSPESLLIPSSIVSIGEGVMAAIAQLTSPTTVRVRGSANINDNSEVHINIRYLRG